MAVFRLVANWSYCYTIGTPVLHRVDFSLHVYQEVQKRGESCCSSYYFFFVLLIQLSLFVEKHGRFKEMPPFTQNIFYEVITFTLLHVKLNDISNLFSLTGIPLPICS
jgi:hypothetical protein